MSLAELCPPYSFGIETVSAAFDATLLPFSSVFRGEVRRGENQPVMVIPGAGGSDVQFLNLVMHNWINRIGYSAVPSGVLWNMGRIESQIKIVEDNTQKAAERFGEKVTLVGASVGGLYALDIAARRPEIVKACILLGTPVNGNPEESIIWWNKLIPGNNIMQSPVGRRTPADVDRSIPITCIYGKYDQMFPNKRVFNHPGVRTYAVVGSHMSMMSSPGFYKAVASVLPLRK